jgi:hypothetical protein
MDRICLLNTQPTTENVANLHCVLVRISLQGNRSLFQPEGSAIFVLSAVHLFLPAMAFASPFKPEAR